MNNLGLGSVSLAVGRVGLAERQLLDAASGMRALDQLDEYALALAHLTLVERLHGRRDSALAYVREALQIAESIRAFAPARFAIHSYSLMLADDGSFERAVELYTFAIQQPYFGNSIYRQGVIGHHVERLTDGLSPDRRQAAEERGLARELWQTVERSAGGVILNADAMPGQLFQSEANFVTIRTSKTIQMVTG